ncbi:hypothetical protein [Caudoviricetes sp.]|nr:hypothetical protein [Caudoviricetes sp.]
MSSYRSTTRSTDPGLAPQSIAIVASNTRPTGVSAPVKLYSG